MKTLLLHAVACEGEKGFPWYSSSSSSSEDATTDSSDSHQIRTMPNV